MTVKGSNQIIHMLFINTDTQYPGKFTCQLRHIAFQPVAMMTCNDPGQ